MTKKRLDNHDNKKVARNNKIARILHCLTRAVEDLNLSLLFKREVIVHSEPPKTVCWAERATIVVGQHSYLLYPGYLNTARRYFILSGKAWFNFDATKSSSVWVHVDEAIIQTSSASFYVDTYVDNNHITVFRGFVNYTKGLTSIRVEAGEILMLDSDIPYKVARKQPLVNDILWVVNEYQFDSSLIYDVFVQVQLVYSVTIETSRRDSSLRFTGRFNGYDPVNTVLDLMVREKLIEYRFTSNTNISVTLL